MPDDMKCPEDIDSLLSYCSIPATKTDMPIVNHPGVSMKWKQDDVNLIQSMLKAMQDGAEGAVIVRREHGLEYMLINMDRMQAVQLFAQAIDLNAQRLP